MNKNEKVKKTDYSDIKDDLVIKLNEWNEKDRHSVFIFGDFGSGKTTLINSIKRKVEKDIKVVEAAYNDEKYFDNIFKKVKDNKQLKWFYFWKQMLKTFSPILISIFIAGIGLFAIPKTEDNLWYILPIAIFSIASSGLIILSLFYFFYKPKKEKKKIVVIENLDRYPWDSIYKVLNDSLGYNNFFIFTMSMENIEDRYYEKYSTNKTNISFLLEKYFSEIIYLDDYKYSLIPQILSYEKTGIINFELKNHIDYLPVFNIRLIQKTNELIKEFNMSILEDNSPFSKKEIDKMKEVLWYLNYLKVVSFDKYNRFKKYILEGDYVLENKNKNYNWWDDMAYIREVNLENKVSTEVNDPPEWAEYFYNFFILILRKIEDFSDLSLEKYKLKIKWEFDLKLFFMKQEDFNESIKYFTAEKSIEKIVSSNISRNNKVILMKGREKEWPLEYYDSIFMTFHFGPFNIKDKELIWMINDITKDKNVAFETKSKFIDLIIKDKFQNVINSKNVTYTYLFLYSKLKTLIESKNVFEEELKKHNNHLLNNGHLTNIQCEAKINNMTILYEVIIKSIKNILNLQTNKKIINYYSIEKLYFHHLKNKFTQGEKIDLILAQWEDGQNTFRNEILLFKVFNIDYKILKRRKIIFVNSWGDELTVSEDEYNNYEINMPNDPLKIINE